jgi:RNA polymerase sigma-70 factor (ECF subfamily)
VVLVERAQAGERWAKETLVRRHMKEVGRLVSYLLESNSDVDDVVQDTFLAALSGLEGLREPAAFRGWLLRIAINTSRRSIRKRRFLRGLGLDRGAEAAVLESFADEGVGPEARAELVALDRVLSRMPSDQRIAWILRYVEGHTVRDVSRLCQSSLATTKRRLARANSRLAKVVDEEVLFRHVD